MKNSKALIVQEVYKLFFFLTLFVSFQTKAQNQSQIKIGVRAGLNTAQFVSSIAGNSNRILRPSAGLAVEYSINPHFSLNTELSYSKMGGRYQSAFGANTITFTRQFDQLYIPVLLRYYPKASRVFIEAGGQIGYVLSSQITLDDASKGTIQNYNKWNQVDGGLVVGTGYKLSDKLLLSLRFYKGEVAVFPSYTSTDPATGLTTMHNVVKTTNQTISINATYYF